MNKNWYTNCRAEIERLYGNDADLFCHLLAATSPRKQVTANWRLAERIYESYKMGTLDLAGTLPAHRPNVMRAIAGEELSGRKVRAFARNLCGDMDVVCVDVWMMRWAGFKKLTDKTYTFIENLVKQMAAVYHMKPAEMQAELWCDIIRENGKTPRSYLAAIDNQMYFWENADDRVDD